MKTITTSVDEQFARSIAEIGRLDPDETIASLRDGEKVRAFKSVTIQSRDDRRFRVHGSAGDVMRLFDSIAIYLGVYAPLVRE